MREDEEEEDAEISDSDSSKEWRRNGMKVGGDKMEETGRGGGRGKSKSEIEGDAESVFIMIIHRAQMNDTGG